MWQSRVSGWWLCCWAAVGAATGGWAAAEEVLPQLGAGRGPGVPPLRVERVELVTAPALAVRIVSSGPVTPAVRRFATDGRTPERVVVDLPRTVLGPAVARATPGQGAVAQVRAGQFTPDTARVVVELRAPAAHEVDVQGAAVTVRVAAGEPAAAPAAPKAPAAAAVPAKTKVQRPPAGGAAATVRPAPHPAAAAEWGPDEQPRTTDAAPLPAATPPPAPIDPAVSPFLAIGGGARLLWPAVPDARDASDDAAPLREALARWRADGTLPPDAPAPPRSVAAALLAADVRLVRAVAGQGDALEVLAAYEGAARVAGDDPDAARAALMQGAVAEWIGLGPEASSAYGRFLERFPGHPLAPWARLGQAAALRLRRRHREARAALDALAPGAGSALACAASLERLRLQRALSDTGGTLATARDLAARCPDVVGAPGGLREVADALAAAGAPDEARHLLLAERAPRAPEEEAALDLLAGQLAWEAGDAETARLAWERVLGRRVPRATRLDAERRITALDPDPRRGADRLVELAGEPQPLDGRVGLLVEAAEAKARAGALDEALVLLDRAAALGPDAAATADARRAAVLGRVVAAMRAAQDWSGLVTLYAAHTTTLRQLADPACRQALADALAHAGLTAQAAELLAPLALTRDPIARVAYAERAMEAGDTAGAREALVRLDATALPPDVAARVAHLRARLALAAGDPAAAAAALAAHPDAALSAEVARAWVVAGDAAAASGAFDDATRDYQQALAVPGGGGARRAAAMGLARVALARGDVSAGATALDEAARDAGPLVRRAAAALLTAGARTEDDHGR